MKAEKSMPTSLPARGSGAQTAGRTLLRRLDARFSGSEVWLMLVLLLVAGGLWAENFATPLNLNNLLKQTSIIGILAIAQFLVIVAGGFDLSVAGILALTSVITARYYPEIGGVPAIALALLTGLVLGLCNGLVITRGRVPPLVATLAMLGIARGIAFTITERSILANDFRPFGNASLAGVVPLTAIIWLALVALVYLFLRYTPVGLHIFAVGGREDTARLAGINVTRVKLLVYTLAGFLSGIGGILFVARSGSGVPNVGEGWELDTIAAVIIGGTNLFGGEGSLLRAMGGVLVYMVIRNVMNLSGIDPYYQDIIKAGIILVAVALRVARMQTQDEVA
jgi:ribose transport system permease protein